jgi:DNA-binding transcriptional LysR family regulator
MMELNIRKLRGFILVAELKSFRRAADKLCISSSALSTQIRELEEMVGVPLLRRTTRSVQITSEGSHFLARSQQLLTDADALIKEFQNTAKLQDGRVTIACVPTLTAKMLPLAITRFSKRYPGIKVRIFDESSRFIGRYIEDGEADFGIGKVPGNARDFEVTPMFEDPFVALVSSEHPLANRRQVRFAELARFPFIRLKAGEGMLSALNKAAQDSGIVIEPRFELTHYYSIGRLVQAGLGITAMPTMALPMVNLSGLVPIPIVAPTVSRNICVIRQKGAELAPPAQRFLSVLTKVVSELRQDKG